MALYPSVAFGADDVERIRPQMLRSLLGAPPDVRRELRVGEADLRAAARSLDEGDEGPARRLMTDERLPQVLLSGSPARVGQRLAEVARRHRPTSIGLALLDENLPVALDAAAEALATVRRELGTVEPRRAAAPTLAVGSPLAGAALVVPAWPANGTLRCRP